ncbi:MAG: hypothetical protein P4L84_12430 [Isosphaeraceae bacterium]|nr:hypothetical protein [Isosphaeraceae bacterium]
MKRRQVFAGLFSLGLCLCGCETLRHGHTSKSDDDADSDEAAVVGVRAKPPSGFFKGTRLPGGLSSEAREIENDFGIQ